MIEKKEKQREVYKQAFMGSLNYINSFDNSTRQSIKHSPNKDLIDIMRPKTQQGNKSNQDEYHMFSR